MKDSQAAEAAGEIIPASESSRLLAVDVGAGSGAWTRHLSTIFREIIAIEPDARAFNAMPHHESVIAVRAMVGACGGRATLYLRDDVEMNSAFPSHFALGRIACPVITLDRLCPGGADFVKVDTGGYEQPVLAGCQDVARWAKAIFAAKCSDNADGVVAELRRLGKKTKRVVRGSDEGSHWIFAA